MSLAASAEESVRFDHRGQKQGNKQEIRVGLEISEASSELSKWSAQRKDL